MNEDELARVARRQWGAFSHRQALAAGVSRWSIQRRLEQGEWVVLEHRVYRFRGGHESWHQKVVAATLALEPNALASHRTAAFLWGLEGFGSGPPSAIDVTVPIRVSRQIRLARVHHTRRPAACAVYRQGIRTTPLVRTLVDLADLLLDEPLFVALDSARRKRNSILTELDAELTSSGDGRRGSDRLAALLARFGAQRETDSPLEARVVFAIDRFGLPAPSRQIPIRDLNGRPVGRVDLVWDAQRVVVECDSRAFHLDPVAFERDLRRRRKAESLGWRLVHVTTAMLADDDWLEDLALLLDPQRLLALF